LEAEESAQSSARSLSHVEISNPSQYSISINIEESHIEQSILRKSIFSICIEDIDRGCSIPNAALVLTTFPI
jgi:hypothetical protein